MHSIFKLFLLIGAPALLSACGKKSNNGANSTRSNLQLIISGNVASQNLSSNYQTLSCPNISVGASNYSGACFNATKLKAKASQFSVGSSFGNDGGGARVINFAAAPSGQGFGGPFGLIGLASFDFATPAAAKNNYSEDNFQDAGPTIYYNRGVILTGSLDAQIEIPSGNSNVSSKFWTLRYAFLDQDLGSQLSSSNQTLSDCASGDNGTRNKLESENLFSSPTGFKKGDILICQKTSASAACEDSDFKWINSTNGALVETRPSAPVRLSGEFTIDDTTCSANSGRTSLSLGLMHFRFNLAQSFTMTKTEKSISGTEAEDGSGGERYFEYSYQGACSSSSAISGSCSGAIQTGKYVTFDLGFDQTDMMFVDSAASINLNTDLETDILKKLDSVLPKPIFIANKRIEEGHGDNPAIEATLSVTLSDTE